MSAEPTPEPMAELVAVMARLRRECAWKAGQTHASLVRYLLEETYEVVEAIETGDSDHLREELGDLLLQVVFHAAIAEQEGRFDLDDVAADLIAKLRRRNPHVFSDAGTAGSDPAAARRIEPAEINEQWERIKAAEKSRTGLMDGIPAELPALLSALKAVERLERTGRELPAAEDPAIGDRLLALVVEAHQAGVDPEQELRTALRAAVRRAEEPPDSGRP